ncbi:hypothetical protein H257_14147 [Aphanomyces astaci]|uniref:Endonuclease/exonuclease/phosphatase domain-containing protein n=1 Tax=Aphanomyces astaci TaxID=112090 RepID=W4FSP5_APHAT|nr:hypothetical protein H257_14147 [Aphanomyces astaci]ETV70492.1 hypothetical protein H257_14147 [Aphanomyces astaci]|eukprot:XP_009840204.1 hypothetical protein H257_14147 [Aphanomyces astaci]
MDHGKPCDRQQPLHASVPTTDLRRELSTYVDHRIVQATAPLEQEVDTLRADKEALTALVSATSAAFTTSMRDSSKNAASGRLLNTNNRGPTQVDGGAKPPANHHHTTGHLPSGNGRTPPHHRSSLRTHMQAMQSVSSQLAGLAALGTPATRLPATYPTQPTLTPSSPAPDDGAAAAAPGGSSVSPPDMHTARIQRDNVLLRETLEGEAFIGDAGSTPTLDIQVGSLRIAATNINKNTYGKLSAELATWFRANALDFLIIADSDLPAHKATQLWTHPHAYSTTFIAGTPASTPAVPHTPPPGDNPAAHKEATDSEWQWLAQATTRATDPHHFVVMEGDFNTYGPNPLDQASDLSPPSVTATPASNGTQEAFPIPLRRVFTLPWSQIGDETFASHLFGSDVSPSHHVSVPRNAPDLSFPSHIQRHTYARNNTAVALHTIHSSDHPGTPYMALDLGPGDHTPSRLTGVKPIRVVNTRTLAKADIASFGVDSGLETDRQNVPHFFRDWLLQDMDRPDKVAQGFQSPAGTTWDTHHYDEDMQARCDRSLRTRISPGYGGVSQELWIAACIRARERVIINPMLRTGLVPLILGRKQMIYLAKSDTAHGVVNLDPGLSPWRPITVQSAFSSRIFTVIRDYITPCIPNHEMQHGFQRDRTVQDAA